MRTVSSRKSRKMFIPKHLGNHRFLLLLLAAGWVACTSLPAGGQTAVLAQVLSGPVQTTSTPKAAPAASPQVPAQSKLTAQPGAAATTPAANAALGATLPGPQAAAAPAPAATPALPFAAQPAAAPMVRRSATLANTDPSDAILDRLETQRLSVDFQNLPLEEALDDLRGSLKVNMVVYWPALQQLGITPTTPVTLMLKSAQADAVLDAVLGYAAAGKGVQLGWQVDKGVLEVNQKENLVERRYPRSYYVGDLMLPRSEGYGYFMGGGGYGNYGGSNMMGQGSYGQGSYGQGNNEMSNQFGGSGFNAVRGTQGMGRPALGG